MNTMCWNCRGLRSKLKNLDVSNWINEHGIDLVCLLETKMEVVSEATIKTFWSADSVRWEAVASRGRSDGIVVCWNEEKCLAEKTLKSDKALVVGGKIKDSGREFAFIGLHAPNSASERRLFWREVVEMKNNLEGSLVIMGDFNTTLEASEREGGVFDRREVEDLRAFMEELGLFDLPLVGRFQHYFRGFGKRRGVFDRREAEDLRAFMEELGLFDLPLVGKEFTSFNSKSASRIDRPMVDPSWLLYCSDYKLYTKSRGLSDHTPLILRPPRLHWDFRPFKTWDLWWEEKDFLEIVQQKWDEANLMVPGRFRVVKKIAILKKLLATWHKQEFGDPSVKLKDVLLELDRRDVSRRADGFSHEEEVEYQNLQAEKWKLKRQVESL